MAIQVEDASVDNVVIHNEESTSNIGGVAIEQSQSVNNLHPPGNPPEQPISSLGRAAGLAEGDVRASSSSQVLMT